MTIERKRIIYLVDGSVARTGALVCAQNIARVLAGEAEVVLVVANEAKLEAVDIVHFSKVLRLPIRPLRRSLVAVIGYLPWLLLAACRLRRAMHADCSTYLLINDFHLMHGAIVRFLGYRGKIFTWVRIDPAAFGRVAQLWLKAAQWSSNGVAAVSHFIQEKVPNVSTQLIYDAINPDFITKQPKVHAQGQTFVSIGNYISGKGQDVAIEALSIIAKDWPHACLEFYGSDMGLAKNRIYRAALLDRVKSLGLDKRVWFGEFETDPRGVLSGKLASLNLSRSESFSMTVLEAAGAGLAVIATRSGGPEEIIVDGQTGLLIPIGDTLACAAAMTKLCHDPKLASQMGAAGQKRVQQLFSQETFKDRLMMFLQL